VGSIPTGGYKPACHGALRGCSAATGTFESKNKLSHVFGTYYFIFIYKDIKLQMQKNAN
jgi:hypothetical protein